VRRADTESPRVYVGFGHPMVNQNHRFLLEDSSPTMQALCRFLESASERNVLRNVDFPQPV
jgi:hypothetical protein